MASMDTSHTFTITVGGNDVSGYLLNETFKCVSALTHEIDTADFVVEDKDSSLPDLELWQEVIVTDEGATRVFAGYVTRMREEVAPSKTTKRVTLYCQDYTVLLKTVVVTKAIYTDQTDEAVLDDLFSTYLSEITTTNVTASEGTHSFHFANVTLLDAVQQIAEKTNRDWYVDYDGDLHYFWRGSGAAAAFSLSDAPDYSATYPWQTGSLSLEQDGEGIINKVIVHGGVAPSAVTTQTFSGDGSTAEFTVTNVPIRSIVSITVDGVHQTWATDYAVTTFASVNVLVAYHRGRVRWDGYSPPATGVDNIEVKYTYDSNVQVTVQDDGSQKRYGRTFEKILVRRDITDADEAQAFGEAYLRESARRYQRGRVTVERYGLSSGEYIGLDCSVLGLDSDRGYGVGGYGDGGYGGDTFLIDQVTTRFAKRVGRVVEHSVQFSGIPQNLGQLMRQVAQGQASTGGLPTGGGGGGQGAVGLVTPTGTQETQEAGHLFGGTFEALWPPGEFSWNPSYGTATGIVVGLDKSKTPPAGKVLILNSGNLIGAFGDLNGEYGYGSSIGAMGLGRYGVGGYLTADGTNGLRIFNSNDVAVIALDTAGHAQITGGLTVPAGGYIQSGSGTKDVNLSGFIMDDTEFVGQASGVDQFYVSAADGKAYFAGGAAILDADGLLIEIPDEAVTVQQLLWYKDVGEASPDYFRIYGYLASGDNILAGYMRTDQRKTGIRTFIETIASNTADNDYATLHVDSKEPDFAGDQPAFYVELDTAATSPTRHVFAPGRYVLRAPAGTDPLHIFNLDGTDKFAMGVDDSDGDKFKINSGATLADTSLFEMDSSGNTVITSGTLSMNSHLITSVTDPTNAQDAATKNYVDGSWVGTIGDHGGLAGLADDDHAQYLNATRHDADDHSGLTRVKEVQVDMGGASVGTSNTNYQTVARSATLVDTTKVIGSPTVYFEALIYTSNGSYAAYAELYNNTDSTTIASSEITTIGTNWVRVRSAAITLTSGSKEYVARIKTANAAATAYISTTRLIFTWS